MTNNKNDVGELCKVCEKEEGCESSNGFLQNTQNTPTKI